ncbi:MAG: NAD(P)H-binding protein [bacterium]|nr:NAD(P)H-binding protein [bacterium]
MTSTSDQGKPSARQRGANAKSKPKRPRVVIAGGSGFVGRALAEVLSSEYEVVSMSRSGRSPAPGVQGVACDLFSLLQTERAVAGADYAVYLVHSMNPTARLTQADFEDLDLIMADNFARACALGGVRQIVYLGGLIPENTELSRHLQSRLETERALGAQGTPVTAVRAGLIIGGAGSSFRILFNVVKRLPVMICPQWTRSLTQPVALEDAVRVIHECLGPQDVPLKIVNIGGPEVLSYQSLMKKTARVLGRQLRILTVPINSYALSRLWVQLFSGASAALVAPLVESLKDSMLAEPNYLKDSGTACETALKNAIREMRTEDGSATEAAATKGDVSQKATPSPAGTRSAKKIRDVRSVQRIPLPAGKTAEWASRRYAIWLDRITRPFLAVHFDRRNDILQFRFGPILLLELSRASDRSAPNRVLFYITDGVLLHRERSGLPGRLEFRGVFGGEFLLAAIHDFRPGLPWSLYNLTQAKMHLFVMRSFSRHLERYAARKKI